MQEIHFYDRNIGLLTQEEQLKLNSFKVLVCGVGGVGGICNELLVRAGVGNLFTIDCDVFELTNLNRQIHSTLDVLGKSKIQTLHQKLSSINPNLNFYGSTTKLEPSTYDFYINKISSFSPNIIIDAFDNAAARVLIYRISRTLGIDYLYAACSSNLAIVSIFSKKSPNLEQLFNLQTENLNIFLAYNKLEKSKIVNPAFGPATNLCGCLATNAALNYLLKRKGAYPLAPKIWFVNINSSFFFKVKNLKSK